MRIAIVTETFAPATDGIVTRLTNFVLRFKELGHEVIVISPNLGIDNYKGIPVYGLDGITVPLYGSRPWGLPSTQVRTILEDFQPDIVHAVNPFSLGTSGVHYANKLDIPLMGSYHTHMPNYLDHYNLQIFKPLLWEHIRLWHNKCDFNITVSESLMDELNAQNVTTQDVLPRGIDLDNRHPDYFDQDLHDQLTGQDPSKKLLFYIGRLAAEKDIDHLRVIFDHRDDITLAIVGDGPDRDRLEEVFAGTDTHFLGFKHGEELSRAFATGDAFIFPSTSETFGLVISESMASGVPVFAAKSEPTCEQISHKETGIIYEAGNGASLMAALENLDNSLLMQKIALKARSEALNYTWDNATHKMLDFYEETIEIHQSKKLVVASRDYWKIG